MCTILVQSETLPAEKRSRKDSQTEVDKLMAYDRKLSEPFTREELQNIFSQERFEKSLLKLFFQSRLYADYMLLNDEEKKIVEELELTPAKTAFNDLQPNLSLSDKRRQLKADLLNSNYTPGCRNSSGHIYVWLDTGCYCKSTKSGFYYVRYYNSLLQQTGPSGAFSTAYAHPVLVVQKHKLRPYDVMISLQTDCFLHDSFEVWKKSFSSE